MSWYNSLKDHENSGIKEEIKDEKINYKRGD